MKKQQNRLSHSLYTTVQSLFATCDKAGDRILSIYQQLIGSSPYVRLLRLNNPTGFLLLLAPTWWAIAFAVHSLAQLAWFCFIFGLGAIIMRSAGCIINDLVDYKLDRLVLRTKTRPLASGELSKKKAMIILLVLLLLAFAILMILPEAAVKIGVFAVIPIMAYPLALIPIITYPFAKRFTFFPQVILGFTFNLGLLMAWAAVTTSLPWQAVVLYIATALWTVGYDTIYAYQDITDDALTGIKSMAIKVGEGGPAVIWVLYQIAISLICIVGLNMHMNAFFYVGMALAGYHMYWQTETLDIRDDKDCAHKFRSNVEFAFLVFIAILIGKI